ncbi:MAG: glycosyltransferase family 4 protein [Candidatus Omnitrophica bacterium]|nr:glycosyltransferase family 4 protein [Candidatus Omnitrophota bacterium]
MKITFVLPSLEIGGGVRVVFEHANRLRAKGHDVQIVYPLFPLDFGQPGNRIRLFIHRVRMFIDNLVQGNRVDWFDVTVPVCAVLFLDDCFVRDADIIIATAWPTAYYVNRSAAQKGRKVYFIQHYEVVLGGGRLVDATYRMNLRQIVIAPWLEKLMVEKFGKSRPDLIPNGVNFKIFYNEHKTYHQPRRILMLYSLSEWKGAADGIAAFEQARGKHPDVQLVLFGRFKDRRVPPYAEFHIAPQGEALRRLYCSGDIFLSPSWTEGWQLPPMEAMACKCAVVATNVGGIPHYTIAGTSALVCEPHRPDELARQLIRLLDDPQLLASITEEGHRYITRFSWEAFSDQFEQSLERIRASA